MTEKNTTTTDSTAKPAATLDDLRALTRQIEALETLRLTIAREVPPIRFSELCSDGCNIKDSTFERDVRRFMDSRMKEIDVTMLDRDDLDKWECLTPRYEVRELDPTEDGDEQYGVFDCKEGSFVIDEDAEGDAEVPLAFDDESDAEDRARELESDDDSRYGIPFAQTTGFIVCKGWIPLLSESGFEVFRYDGDEIIAGIDGGGYSFMGAHFAPFYARLAAKNDWLVETQDGPRRIVMD